MVTSQSRAVKVEHFVVHSEVFGSQVQWLILNSVAWHSCSDSKEMHSGVPLQYSQEALPSIFFARHHGLKYPGVVPQVDVQYLS